MKLFTIHVWDDRHLAEVMAEMERLGAPTIRVVDCGDHWQALEGVHRIEAARRLGLAPEFDVLAQDDLVPADSLDWQDYLISGESYPAGELAAEAYSTNAGCYDVDLEIGLLALV